MANLALVKVGQTLTAAILNGIIGRVNGQALTGIVPGSVTGGTVSQNGSVTFTNSPGLTVGRTFTTNYDNYRFVWNSTGRTDAASIQFRYASSGSVYTSSNYAWLRGQDQGTARSITSGTASSAFPIDSPVASGMKSDGYVDLFGPAVGLGSSVGGLATMYDSTNGMTQVQFSGRCNALQAFDGFTIFPTTGTFTGMLRIYGYNNLI